MREPAHQPRPLLALAGFLGAGSFVGDELPVEAVATLLGLAAVGLLLCLIAGTGAAVSAGLCAVAFGAGAAGHAVEREGYDRTALARFVREEQPDAPVWLEGRALADARRAHERTQLLIAVERVRWRGSLRPTTGVARVNVSDPAARLDVAQGEALLLWATLHAPRGYASPGAFDFAADARRRGIHAVGFCKSTALLSRGGAVVAGVSGRVAAWRRSARAVFVAALPPGDEQGLVRAMVLGDRAGLSSEASEAFRVAGTYHVLALSGAQVALVAGLLLLALRRLRLPPMASALALAAAVSLYALFVGADAPVTRAAVMAVCLALGKAIDLDGDLANLLGFAAAALLLQAPSAIGDPSFQLSFAATLGILLLARPVAALLPVLPLQLSLVIAVSVAAQAALLPLLAAHFHRLAPAAVLMNLAAGPLSAAVLVSGFVLLLMHAIVPPLEGLAASAAWHFAHWLLRSGDAARALPWLDVRVPTPSLLESALYLLGLAWLVRGRRTAGAVAALAALASLYVCSGVAGDGRLWLSVLDVGHGDALVLRSPAGRLLLVDAGPATRSFDLGEAVVAPYLWSLGARRVGSLALSHADGDHVGGAPFLVRSFAVRDAFEGIAPLRDPRYERLAQALAAGPRRVSLRPGALLDWDGVTIEVLGPRPGAPPKLARNDHSLVLKLRYLGVSLLLMGDSEREAERLLAPGRADVLKVGHHGSSTSTGAALLESTRPRVALVSGPNDAFGHPSPEVLKRLAAAGALTLRTDRDGTVTVITDGSRIWLASHRNGSEKTR